MDATEARRRADSINDLGIELQEQDRWDDALGAYLAAAEADPGYWAPWFNRCLIHKWRSQWCDVVRCATRAIDLEPPEPAAALWNLGIAASAVADWPLARRAWEGLGLALEPGDGPPSLPIGVTPIQLRHAASGRYELVWTDRFDPVRARILNVPTLGCGYNWHDVVLHDAEPVGKRLREGRPLSVFQALARLEPSPYRSWGVSIRAPAEADATALVELVHAEDRHAEDWTESIEALCDECAREEPHEHPEPRPASWRPERRFGIAIERAEGARELLERWAAGGLGREFDEIQSGE